MTTTIANRIMDFSGETCTYTKVGGTTRSIKAIIGRNQETSTGSNIKTSTFTARVINDSTLGISSDEIDTGGDSLTFPRRINGTTKVWKIKSVSQPGSSLNTSIGLMQLELA